MSRPTPVQRTVLLAMKAGALMSYTTGGATGRMRPSIGEGADYRRLTRATLNALAARKWIERTAPRAERVGIDRYRTTYRITEAGRVAVFNIGDER